jgi:hypothetical protein
MLRLRQVWICVLLVSMVWASPSMAQGDERRWELLGEKTVGFLGDRDVISLDQDDDWYREKGYRRLRLSVDRNDIHVNRIRLVYFNNFAESFRVDRTVREDGELNLRLGGNRGYLRRVEISYRSRPSFEGRARVRIYGQLASVRDRDDLDRNDIDRDDVVADRERNEVVALNEDREPRGSTDSRWLELGCRQIRSSGRDRDTIDVGNREGWFRAIRLSAEGNDVEILGVQVIYGNGAPDELDVRRILRDGDRSRPYDLRGAERTIERIELAYRQRDDDRDRTRVCVEGLLAG